MCFSAPMKSKRTPNGGWGWMVVLGAAITNMTNQSMFSQFGLIFGDKLTEMGCGTGGAALVINISSMITNFSGLVTGPILKHYSPRNVTLLGIFLTASGMGLSSVATNLIELIICYSVFTGLGLGLIMPATFVAVNEYFTSRKSQAVGLSMAGTGVGQMIMPQVARFLLDEYGYRGTTLILGALCLNGLPGALLFHPVKWHMIETNTTDEEKEPLLVKNIQICRTSTKYGVVEEPGPSSNENKGKTFLCKVIEFFNFELLKDWVFLHLINGLALVYTCTVAFNMIFPFFLQNSVGLSRGDTALCMSLLSGADIVGRVTIPMITKYFRISNRMTFLLGTVSWAVFRSVLAEQQRFSLIVLLSILCGFIRAAAVVTQNLAVTEYCKDESKIPSAIGLNMVAKGLLVLGVGQFLGWVRDYTQSFVICLHVQSAVMMFVALTWSTEILARKLYQRYKS